MFSVAILTKVLNKIKAYETKNNLFFLQSQKRNNHYHFHILNQQLKLRLRLFGRCEDYQPGADYF